MTERLAILVSACALGWLASPLDVSKVMSGVGAKAQGIVPLAIATEDLRLDATREDLPTITRLFVGPASRIVIPLATEMQLRIYDSTGTLKTTIGRRGAGPGEFQFVNRVGWMKDSMWVDDAVLHRISWFSPDLKFVRTQLYPAIPASLKGLSDNRVDGFVAYGILAMRPDGMVLADAVTFGGAAATSDAERAWGSGRWLVALGPGARSRVLRALPWSGDRRWSMSVGGYGRPLPFAQMPIVTADASGRRVAYLTSYSTSSSTGEYLISVVDANGDSLFARSFVYTGVPIPARIRDSAIAAMFPQSGRAAEGSAAGFVAAARERMPHTYPGVAAVILGLDGTTWIEQASTPTSTPYLILDSEGNPVARLQLPIRSRVQQASKSQIWVIETDVDGLTSVVRYRVDGIRCPQARCS